MFYVEYQDALDEDDVRDGVEPRRYVGLGPSKWLMNVHRARDGGLIQTELFYPSVLRMDPSDVLDVGETTLARAIARWGPITPLDPAFAENVRLKIAQAAEESYQTNDVPEVIDRVRTMPEAEAAELVLSTSSRIAALDETDRSIYEDAFADRAEGYDPSALPPCEWAYMAIMSLQYVQELDERIGATAA